MWQEKKKQSTLLLYGSNTLVQAQLVQSLSSIQIQVLAILPKSLKVEYYNMTSQKTRAADSFQQFHQCKEGVYKQRG